MRAPRLALAAVSLATVLGVAACGSANTSSTAPVTVTKIQTVTVSTTGSTASTPATTTTGPAATGTTNTSPSTTTGTTTSSASGGAGGRCDAADLTPVSQSTNGAAGTILWQIALKNTGGSSCATEGYPGAQFLDSGGNPIGKPAVRTTTSAASGTVEPKPITLAPGASAYFYIQVDDAAGGGAGCQNVSYLQIYAPDDTTAMRLTASQEIQYCPKLTVTPLQADAGAQ